MELDPEPSDDDDPQKQAFMRQPPQEETHVCKTKLMVALDKMEPGDEGSDEAIDNSFDADEEDDDDESSDEEEEPEEVQSPDAELVNKGKRPTSTIN